MSSFDLGPSPSPVPVRLLVQHSDATISPVMIIIYFSQRTEGLSPHGQGQSLGGWVTVSLDQLIVQTAHGNVIGWEDLARWRSDCGGEGEEDLGRNLSFSCSAWGSSALTSGARILRTYRMSGDDTFTSELTQIWSTHPWASLASGGEREYSSDPFTLVLRELPSSPSASQTLYSQYNCLLLSIVIRSSNVCGEFCGMHHHSIDATRRDDLRITYHNLCTQLHLRSSTVPYTAHSPD
jgi:hypothetical protein